MTPESSNKFYRSVIKTQSVAIIVMLGVGALALGWYMSRMEVAPVDIMQEVKLQGEISAGRYIDMQESMLALEHKVDSRSELLDNATAALSSIQNELQDHDSRLERIEKVITGEAAPNNGDAPNGNPEPQP